MYLCLFVHHEMYFVFYNNEYTVVSVSLIIFYFIMCSILNSEGFVLWIVVKYHCVANKVTAQFYVVGLYKVLYEFLEMNMWCKNWIYLERQVLDYKIMFSV